MKKILLGLLSGALLGLAQAPLAEDFPKKPIHLVVPVAAGDGFDVAGRIMAEELTRLLNVPVLVTNRPGAGGVVATDSVVRAGKDGYTILLGINPSLTFRPVLDPQGTRYDPMKDLIALGGTELTPSILVVSSEAPFKSFRDMVEYSKKNPGQVRVGTAGQGSVGDFCVQIVNSLTNAGLTMVPFKGSSPALTALRGGHVEAVVASLGSVSGTLKSGAVRGIAISSKFPDFPDVPTLIELGYQQNLLGVWSAFFAPAGVPDDAIKLLIPAIEKVLKDPHAAAKILPLGIVHDYMPPHKLLDMMRDERQMVETIARRAGFIK
jgi:tripartite-type tricarboxylate transporter receptor subunit TctC